LANFCGVATGLACAIRGDADPVHQEKFDLLNILFFIPRMSVGGAERVLSEIANSLVRGGYGITIATMGSGGDFYRLDPNIQRVKLALMHDSGNPFAAILGNARAFLRIRRTVRESEASVVVSFLDRTNVRVLLAALGLKTPVVVTEHSDPRTHPIGFIWSLLRRLLYPRAAFLVGVSQGVCEGFFWLPKNRRAVIYNPVPQVSRVGSHADLTMLPVDRKYLASAGRFVPTKAFDRLIRGFKDLSDDNPDWDLVLFGDGPLREDLVALADALGLSHRVRFPGFVADLYWALNQCHLFCLTSTTEGLGMVILEAMQADLPVVSTDCPTGPREIIQDGENGRLIRVGDHATLVRILGELMKNSEERRRLATGARNVLQRHSTERIIEDWKSLLSRFESGNSVRRYTDSDSADEAH
jgi:GalNAc-alpha-(1->4)-GalNAc-alpha-(1->3)-diNAcBac-PP-undecaprenol alpha-1,4-N-acetyl-D-galactosaminyltransferase